jgi:hypothetical protein
VRKERHGDGADKGKRWRDGIECAQDQEGRCGMFRNVVEGNRRGSGRGSAASQGSVIPYCTSTAQCTSRLSAGAGESCEVMEARAGTVLYSRGEFAAAEGGPVRRA